MLDCIMPLPVTTINQTPQKATQDRLQANRGLFFVGGSFRGFPKCSRHSSQLASPKTETTSIMEIDAPNASPATIVQAQTRMLESIRSNYNACQR